MEKVKLGLKENWRQFALHRPGQNNFQAIIHMIETFQDFCKYFI
jgi:hypothetical protein